jgi:hypothetical protein
MMIKPRRIRRAGHVARTKAKINAYKVVIGKYEGKRPLERPRCRLEGNVKTDL